MAFSPPNYTQIPNELLDRMDEMTPGEFKVTCAVARKTIGWHKDSDLLSLSQLEKLTGMSRPSVVSAVDLALDHGFIERQPKGKSFTYRLSVKELDQLKSFTDKSKESLPSSVKELDTQKKEKKLKEKTCSSSAPEKAKDLDPSVLLPSSQLLGSAVPKPKVDPLMLERTLQGAYLFSLKDLRSFSAAHEAAASLITLDPTLWRWLVDLKRKGKTDNDTFSSYPEDVLTHVDTYGAERVKAALKYTVQKPGLRNPWTYFLDRVARDTSEPSQSTDRVSSEKVSARGEQQERTPEDADRYKEPYPGAWDMATLLATAPTTGDWRKR